jgi:hypothetical protein
MTPLTISSIVFVCVFSGAMIGLMLHRILPEPHLTTESKDVVKLGMGLVATMSALVLALLIASAKGSYETQSGEIVRISAGFVQLDRVLQHYGPETAPARALLRKTVTVAIQLIWSDQGYQTKELDSRELQAAGNQFFEMIENLTPANDAQRSLQSQALTIASDIGNARLLLLEQARGSIAMPFLIVLVFWLTMIFVSFGLFAPSNGTVIAVLLVCAMSVSGAIFLVLELDRPFSGLMQISSAPMRDALAHLGG